MFLNLDDVKQVGVMKSSTPRKQIPAPTITRTVKEARPTLISAECGDKQTQPVVRDTKQTDLSNEGNSLWSQMNVNLRVMVTIILGPLYCRGGLIVRQMFLQKDKQQWFQDRVRGSCLQTQGNIRIHSSLVGSQLLAARLQLTLN